MPAARGSPRADDWRANKTTYRPQKIKLLLYYLRFHWPDNTSEGRWTERVQERWVDPCHWQKKKHNKQRF